MQINPVIMQLVGELHALCFATSNTGTTLVANVYTRDVYGHFNIVQVGDGHKSFISIRELTVSNLKAAIAKLEEVVYA